VSLSLSLCVPGSVKRPLLTRVVVCMYVCVCVFFFKNQRSAWYRGGYFRFYFFVTGLYDEPPKKKRGKQSRIKTTSVQSGSLTLKYYKNVKNRVNFYLC